MNYYILPPPPDLAHVVRFFWVLECAASPENPYVQRTNADGSVELLFHYKGRFNELLPGEKFERSFLSGFHGQSATFRRFRIEQDFGIFGVYLYPYAVPALFNVSAMDLTDQMVDLASLLGRFGQNLEEQVTGADCHEQRMQIVSRFLRTSLSNQKKVDVRICRAIRYVIQVKGQIKIERLADEHFLSRRQFERSFKEYAGFNPKTYASIIRFQSVFRELSAAEGLSLTEIAYRCGYYDQSHFINEFRRFSGFSPSQYLKDNTTETTIWES